LCSVSCLFSIFAPSLGVAIFGYRLTY